MEINDKANIVITNYNQIVSPEPFIDYVDAQRYFLKYLSIFKIEVYGFVPDDFTVVVNGHKNKPMQPEFATNWNLETVEEIGVLNVKGYSWYDQKFKANKELQIHIYLQSENEHALQSLKKAVVYCDCIYQSAVFAIQQ